MSFRDKLVNLQPSTGYRFDGSGYTVVNSRPYRMRERSDVQLKFKTTVPDGLLFLAGKGQTFLSVELRDGNVLYQVRYFIQPCYNAVEADSDLSYYFTSKGLSTHPIKQDTAFGSKPKSNGGLRTESHYTSRFRSIVERHVQ